MSAIDWPLVDLSRLVDRLNVGEPSYPGVDFFGWSVQGLPFIPPEATINPPSVFGRLCLGRPRLLQAAGDGLQAPARSASVVSLELFFAGSADAAVYTAIYDDAVATLWGANTADLWIEPGTWAPPMRGDLQATGSEFPGFMPVRGDIRYWSGTR